MVLEKTAHGSGPGRTFGVNVFNSTRIRLALVISLVAIIPMVVSNFILMGYFEGKIVDERKERLGALANHIARHIEETVPEALSWEASPVGWEAMHQRIAPLAEDLISDYDDTIVGFFSAKVNAFVAYAPESQYSNKLGQPLPNSWIVHQAYQSKLPIVANAETLAGPGLICIRPIIVSDQVIGHTFAIVTHDKLTQALDMVRTAVGAGTLLLCLLVFAVSSLISKSLSLEVNSIIGGIRQGQLKKEGLMSQIPELSPLLAEVELAADALRQERQRTFDLLDALPLGVVACSPEYQISFINETAADLLGVSIRKSVGQNVDDFLHEMSLTNYEDLRLFHEISLGQRDAGYGIVNYRGRDGNLWPAHALLFPFGMGSKGQRGVLAILYDLSKEIGYDRLQGLFDKEMRKSQVILETLTLGVVAIDQDGLLTTCNRVAGTMLEIDPLAVLGKPMGILPEPLIDALQRAQATQQSEKHLYLAVGENEFMIDIAPLPGQGGVVAVIADVTLWNKMQRDAQRSDRLALIGEMAAGTAHEIRNPLTALRGFLQLFQQRMGASGGSELELEWIELMLGEADQINHVVNEFLQLARSRERKVSVIEPAKIIQSLFPVIQNECRLRDMTAELVVDPDLPHIEVDPEQLKQVILNLARNGMEAMTSGGTLRLSVNRDQDPSQIAMSVSDQGCGIVEDDLKRIFNPFYTTRETGTGLGLPICQRIVEDHHGQIAVTSKVGVGSTFTVLLPVAASTETTET